MCVMAIHAKSETANAIQAMAHNADTLARDASQLANLLIARNDPHHVNARSEQQRLEQCAMRLWTLWRSYVGPDAVAHGIVTGVGHEADRVLDAAMRSEAISEDMDSIAAVANG